jgi:hypothetical protein
LTDEEDEAEVDSADQDGFIPEKLLFITISLMKRVFEEYGEVN